MATGTPITGVSFPYKHSGLTDGKPYYYIVTAERGGVTSAPSTEISACAGETPVWLIAQGPGTLTQILMSDRTAAENGCLITPLATVATVL
ncbi:MAG: hypothetical protein WA705_00950, partial [Candidatus Ozemobacteraceae bacterium]